MSAWAAVQAWEGLAPTDRHVGDLLLRLDPEHGGAVALAGAALMALSRRGDACAALTDLGNAPFPGDRDDGPRLPDAAAWRSELLASPLVGDGAAVTPLVLQGDRLYLYRYFRAERQLGAHLRERALQPARAVDAAALGEWFATAAPGATPWQAVACFAAARSRIAVVTGGPGTGKTWTVARLLALLLRRQPDLRVHLAAPTGKAAARLSESIAGQLQSLDLDAARLPSATTIHKLLGYRPADDSFRHGAQRPLATDCVVLDEASMVDLLLMNALFEAVPPEATIVLLGDPDQLASVATGYVLGALCATAPGDRFSPEFAAAWEQAWPGDAPLATAEDTPAPPLLDALVHLEESRRFDPSSPLGALARAIQRGDGAAAVAAAGPALVPARDWVDHLADDLDAWAEALQRDTCEEVLALLPRFQVLCAHRTGPRGVADANRAIEAALRARGVDTSSPHYHGRPVLVTANDHGHRLFNGDVGVCWRTPEGTRVVFPTPDAPREVLPGRLPPHETAWALTVHKSQGSEYERVLLLLPDADAPLANRELIYTAVTRAREGVVLAGTAAALHAACERRVARSSGLTDLLR